MDMILRMLLSGFAIFALGFSVLSLIAKDCDNVCEIFASMNVIIYLSILYMIWIGVI